MNEELIKKVYEHFNGVWPKRAEVILTTAEGWNGSERLVGKFTEGWYDEGILMHNLSSFLSDYDDKVCEPWLDEKDSWVIACTEDQFKAYGESLKKEWMPEVGEECEYKYDFFFIDRQVGKCTPIAFHDGKVWVELSIDKTHHLIDAGKIKFCPAKSEREKLLEECVNTLKNEPQCDKVNPHHMDAIEWLIDAGFINAPSS